MKRGRKTVPAVIRFLAKVRTGPYSQCWEWTGSHTVKDGEPWYGTFRGDDSVHIAAHRFAYQLWKGPLIDGLVVMHDCDNPLCVNPMHLSQGTQKQNIEDAGRRGRRRRVDDKTIEAIRSDRNGGMKLHEVAEKYGVSESFVSLTARGLRRA